MTDEEKPLLCVRSHSREPESDVSIGDVPTWRILPGCHQATATVDTPLEMVTGSLSVAPRKKCDPEPDMPEPVTPTVPSSLAEDLPPTTRRSSSFADRPVYPVPSSEDRSLQSVGRLGHSETSSLISAEDNVTKPHESWSIASLCPSRKSFVGIIVILIALVTLVVVVVVLDVFPQDINTTTEVYNVNNDTVLAVQFDRSKYNAVILKHIRRDIVHTHTIHVYSQNCKSLTVYNQTDCHTSNHSINVSQHTLVSNPNYLLPGSRMEFNVTILNVPSITAEIYLYIFNDLDILFTYFFEQNLGKYAYRSQVYTHGSGTQSTTTSIEYNVTDRGYWFAAIVCDTPIEMEYSSRFYKVLYDRSKLQERCILEDMDSCELDYSFTSTSQKECVLCYASAPAVITPDPAYVTATVTRRGKTPSFYGALGVLISFSVIVSIITFYGFVRLFKHKCVPFYGKS